ncbi:MAG: hypothetical protein QOG15_3650 [Solirubrobacteraceae bacterium]|nr:hypothetical protein [Solirubrobacteraceae bacterium]
MLALAGCATDYAGDNKKDFVAKGNQICRDTGAIVVPTLKDLVQTVHVPTMAELRSFVGDVAVPALEKRVEKLRQLEPPSGDRQTIADIIRKSQKAIDQISSDPKQLTDGDPFLEANVEVQSYGLTACELGT